MFFRFRQVDGVCRQLGLGKDKTLLYEPLNEVRLVCLDLETTGLSPKNDEIISYGAVAIEGGKIVWESCVQYLFDPGRPIPPLITRLTGITNDMVEQQPPFIAVLPEIIASWGRAILLGHCVHFDLAFINRKLKVFCQRQLPHYTIDVREVTRSLYPNLAGYSLDHVLAQLGLTNRYRRHTALGDALAAAEAFLIMLEELTARGIRTLADLNDFTHYRRHASGGGWPL